MKDKMGLVLYDKKLCYGSKHGYFMWMPMPLKRRIVAAWNFIVCRIYEHDWIPEFLANGDDDMHNRRCYSCCKIEAFEWLENES
jgi:hypothetical protein